MENVQNKMIMITGGASGIGYCIVEELLRNNSKVFFDTPKDLNPICSNLKPNLI